jgi:hypothetical protein
MSGNVQRARDEIVIVSPVRDASVTFARQE